MDYFDPELSIKIIHEHGAFQAHRLVVNNSPSPWFDYKTPALYPTDLPTQEPSYIAFTDYFGERVLKVSSQLHLL